MFCRQSCRQRDYEARRRGEELGLAEHELVVARDDFEALRDRLYVLSCTLEDVERDLAGGDVTDRAALDTLIHATRECVGVELSVQTT